MIEAAQAISEAGRRLDRLGRHIAENCPESVTKNDLLAYLQRIALYTHQLSITSKVKNRRLFNSLIAQNHQQGKESQLSITNKIKNQHLFNS